MWCRSNSDSALHDHTEYKVSTENRSDPALFTCKLLLNPVAAAALVGGVLNAGMSVLLGLLGLGMFAFYHDSGENDCYAIRYER